MTAPKRRTGRTAVRFEEAARIARGRIGALESAHAQGGEITPGTLEELRTAFAALDVAYEQLREQADELATAKLARASDQARYVELFRLAPDAYLMTDQAGVIEEANAAAERLFNRPAVRLEGKPLSRFLPEAERRHFHRRVAEVLAAEGPVQWETQILSTQRTEPVPVSIRAASAIERGGERTGVRWMLHDVSARRAAEEERRRFERMASTAADFMCVVNRDHVCIAANEAFVKAFQRDGESPLGRPYVEVVGAERYETVKSRLDACLAGAPQAFERWAHLPREGQRWIDVRYAPLAGADGTIEGVVVDARDRTEVKLLEEESKRHRDQLASAVRLSSLGEMAAGIAHELNQPLAAITSYADAARHMLESPATAPGEVQEILRGISAQSLRAGTIIARLRAIARRSPGPRVQVDLHELVALVLPLVEDEARRHEVRVSVEAGSPIPAVYADTVQIEQVVLNLLRNAIESLASARRRRRPREVAVRVRSADRGRVALEVEDNGPGLGEGDPDRVFDAFYTTKPDGMGVGLALCRSIAEAHGGRLTAESASGGGALFRLTVPIGRPERGGR